MTAPLVLHHYDFSNYSEKVRLTLGLKGLAWRSVTIPAWAPKPDYTPLTAGYRRTPALQVGADVYCDTALICAVLDELAPTPPLWPVTASVRVQGEALVHWAENALFRPLALYITGRHARRFPPAFHADRARLHGKPVPPVEAVEAAAARYWPQVAPRLDQLEALFADGRTWALGDTVSLADFALYEAPWFLLAIGGDEALPEHLACTRSWMARVAAIGHGQAEPLSADDALALARAATPAPLAPGDAATPEGLVPGDAVSVRPFDQDAPAVGRLVRADAGRITLAVDGPRTGPLQVHFPRLGYRLSRQRG
ncbi:MAG: glutathione S-transferase family protein [Gammaproteobacteria bacterium]